MNPSLAVKAVLIALLLLPLRAFATPFDAARVPAEADGVGHLDMDALRKTTLHRLVAPKIPKTNEWGDVHVAMRPLLKTLLDTAQGVTFWLTDKETGAVLIQVPDGKRIQALLDKVPRGKPIRVAGHVAHRYDLDSHKKKGSDPDDDNLAALVGNFLVMADDEASLGRAIDAATGKNTLAGARKTPDGAAERGVFFFTALNDKLLSEVKNAAQSKTLRINMSSLTVHVGEVRSELKVKVKAMMGSAEEATKLKSMAEGLLALASMTDEAAQLRPFTKGLQITANGRVLEVSLTMPSAEMLKIIESHH
jgi:hypothetical protein